MARFTSWIERYMLIWLGIIFISGLVMVYWALDRRPPFELQSYTASPAVRGEAAYIVAAVKRDLTRDCSVTFTRYLVDKDKTRHDIGGAQSMPPQAIEQLERDTPNELRMAVRIPGDMPVGEATLLTALEYRCNPMHVIRPINVLTEMKVKVLP